MKLRHSIYMMIFLCSFVPVAIWLAFSVYDNEKRMESVVSENIEAITGSQAMSIHNFCEGRKESMETLARMDTVQDALLHSDKKVRNERLEQLLRDNQEQKSYMASISLLDSEFHVLGSSEEYEVYEISDFKYVDPKYHSGQFIMGDAHDRVTNAGEKRLIPAYIGVFYEGELIGYLVQEIECTYFDRLRLQTDFLEDGTLYLLDGKKTLITAGTSEEEESRKETVSSVEERESYQKAWDAFDHDTYSSGKIHYEYQGQKYMTYFSGIEYTDWSLRITENMSAQWKANRSIYLLIALEGIVFVAILFAVQLMVAKRLAAPFHKILDTFKEIQTNHDYSLRTRVNRKDEVGEISEGIDELLDYIEKEELEEKRKHREFAEEARLRAEASNRAKSVFLFNASHDIRTPMNAIHGFTHMIEQNPDDAEVVKDAIGKIKKSNDVLMTLLNNVLELSRIESGKDEVELTALNFNSLTDKLSLMFAQEMEEAGVTFRVENKLDDDTVMADELKCTRILMNMLSNARKFTPAGGTVVFGVQQIAMVSEQRATYRLYVKDTGIGMSEEFQQRAFEQFEMERSSTKSGVVGNGLGLAIIKKLAEQMNGRYYLSSVQGKGTEISVELTLGFGENVAEQKEEPQKEVDFSGKRVLLVEDNEFNREIARFILEDAGIVVEEAEDGSVAVEKIKKAEPGAFDFVLMDIQMPIMDGYTATKEIRSMENPEIANIPIIAMTANAFKEDREKCLAAGMNEHIAKPVDIGKLYRTLQEVCL